MRAEHNRAADSFIDRTKNRFATLCALVRASVSLHLHLRTSRILACLCMRNNAPVEHCVAERFYVIGNEVSYDIKKPNHPQVIRLFIERETGIEPATPTLARWCSTAEPLAQFSLHQQQKHITPKKRICQQFFSLCYSTLLKIKVDNSLLFLLHLYDS